MNRHIVSNRNVSTFRESYFFVVVGRIADSRLGKVIITVMIVWVMVPNLISAHYCTFIKVPLVCNIFYKVFSMTTKLRFLF